MRETEMQIPALTFSDVGSAGAFAPWVRALDGYSGAYVIAERPRGSGPAVVVYVGESHAGRLYDTLTRHFQKWRRAKHWWTGLYDRNDAPGTTYARERCVAAVVLAPNGPTAIDLQAALIATLHPRDNVIGQAQPELEDAPF